MTRRWRLLVLFTALFLSFFAKGRGEVRWLAKKYEYGTFHESEGPRRGHLDFVNQGPDTVMVLRVRPSCGCTGAGFTQGLISPGDTASVWFDFDPSGRPGPFSKHIDVVVTEGGENTMKERIELSGTVIGSDATLDKLYPIVAGPLRLTTDVVDAGDVKKGGVKNLYFTLYNQSDNPMTPLCITDFPTIFSIASSRDTIPPGEMAVVTISYNSTYDNLWGEGSSKLELYPFGKKDAATMKEIRIDRNVLPSPSAVTQEIMEKSPAISLSSTLTDIGEIKSSSSPMKIEFRIGNEGKGDLHVLRVCAYSDALEIKKVPGRVRKGGEEKVKIKVDPKAIPPGPFRLKVDIFTDDPLHPLENHYIVGILDS